MPLDFDKSISLQPNFANSYLYKGYSYAKLNLEDKEGACSDYKMIKKLGEKPNSEIEEYCK